MRVILVAAMAAALSDISIFADDQLPPPITSPPTNAPAAKSKSKTAASKTKKSKSTASKAAPSELSLPLTPGPAVVKQNNVNVRGQAAINSEVIGKLKKDEQVTVIEEVTLSKPKTDEPSHWAKIALPPTTFAWVHSEFIDPNTKTVKPKRLNLRSGPGENYSVIGRVDQGAKIQELEAKDNWLKIEPPAGAYAFVAAHLLRPQIAETALAANQTPKSEKPLETAQVDAQAAPAQPGEPDKPQPATATDATSATPAGAPAPPEEEIKRVVTREGIVRRSVSIQAPTYFVLESSETGRAINYLFSTNIALKDFKGTRIQVVGEELLDERWPNTPVIAVEKLEAVP